MRKNIVIKSKNIFTGNDILDGFIVISDGVIIKVGSGEEKECCHENTEYIDATDGFVMPGLIDTHCFFTGHYVNSYGVDLKNCSSVSDILTKIKENSDDKVFVGRNTQTKLFEALSSDDDLPDQIPVVIFNEDSEKFVINKKAANKYSVVSGDCGLESYWKLIKEILSDQKSLIQGIKDHHHFLNSKGVTSLKEVIFDDSYGFLEAMTEMIKEDTLKLRVRVVSQPVGHDLDIELGKMLRDSLTHENLKFAGYNMMVDGSMSQNEADLKKKYLNTDFHSINGPDYEKINQLVRNVDDNGFRFALHNQGDRAVEKTLDILQTMKKDSSGKLVNKHTMTDIEFGAVEDFKRMASLGVIAEIYPQIQSIYDDQSEKIDMIKSAIGDDISKIWNRRGLIDSGTTVACATDLPLLFPSLPESIFHACGGYFIGEETPFQKENTLTRLELIMAWSVGGAMDFYETDDKLGLLKVGYKADIAIFDQNLLEIPMKNVKEAKVLKTIIDGKIVYSV